MADIMDMPLDEKVLQQIIASVLIHKLTAQQQAEDPLRKAQFEHLNVQTQVLRDANDPAKLLAALSGSGDAGGATPSTFNPSNPMAGATSFFPNGDYVSGSSGPGQAPSYTPPTEYSLGANPYAAEGNAITRTSKGPSDPNADVLIRSKNPATGNPWFGNQLPEWASPEARTAFNADRAGLPGTGETIPQQAKTSTSAGAIDPKRLVAMAIMSKTMENQGFPSDIRTRQLERHFPELMQQKVLDNLEKKQSEADIRKASAPAPAGTYLDENGQKYSPIYGGDIQPKGTFYRNGSTQAKMFDASDMVNNHIDATLEQLQGIAQGDSNRFKQLLSTKLKLLQNDPQVRTLIDTLGPASSMALGQAYAAGGSSMRGGVRMAEMFHNAFYGEGDTLSDSLNKMKTIEKLTLASAKQNNLHQNAIQNIQDRIDAIDALRSGSTGKAGTTSSPNQAGQPKWETSGGVRFYRE